MRVLLVEPPKDYWFLMGEHLPPPLALLQLAAYIELHRPGVEMEVLDCKAEGLDWRGLERRLEGERPDVVAVSGSCTKDAYIVAWTLKMAKEVDPEVFTLTGGQHYSALAEESLREHPYIDAVVRGEGEGTLLELLDALEAGRPLTGVGGLTFRGQDQIVSTPPRPLIGDLNELPMPAYHLVEGHMDRYHFEMMAPGRRYAVVEGSRGCSHSCLFCTQSPFWGGRWRCKSPERLAEEFERLHSDYGVELIWLADDNFPLDGRAGRLCRELIERGLGDDVSWFVQARADGVVGGRRLLPSMRRAGCLLPHLLFILLSPLGVLAALRPDLCLRRRDVGDPSRVSVLWGLRVIHGHHPPCEGFKGHELRVGEKTLCAGCLGLTLGTGVALILIALHLSAPPPIGVLLVSIGLFHPLLGGRPPPLRVMLNALLPLGFALSLLSACRAGGLLPGLLALGFSLLWVSTRIELSRWEHRAICLRCGGPCPFGEGVLSPPAEGLEDDVEAEEDDDDGPDVAPRQPGNIRLQQPDEAG